MNCSLLTNVIGVKSDKSIFNDKYKFIKYPLDGIDILANGINNYKDELKKSRKTSMSNSFATPIITAKVYNILMKNKFLTLEDIKKELYLSSSNFLRV